MNIIEVTVRDRVATHIGDDFYVCGNTEYEIHFDFDEEWDALDIKTARFIADGNVLYPDRIFSGNVCSFPDNPPISNTTSVRVGVFAGNLHTTTPARIPAAKSILCGTSTPAAPDEDAYHEAMEEMSKVATEARAQAEASAKSAEASAQSAVEADASAKAAADSAEASAKSAQASAQSAEASAQSATEADASAKAAEQAKQDAIAQADDAEEFAKEARFAAQDSEGYARSADAAHQAALAASDYALDSAKTSRAKAAESEEYAKASAQSAVEAAESVKDFYIVKVDNAGKSNRTYAEIRAATNKDKLCLLVNTNSDRVYTFYGIVNGACVFKVTHRSSGDSRLYSYVAEVLEDSTVRFYSNPVAAANPKYLYLRGAVKTDYYGGEEVTVNLPTKYPNPNKLTLTGGAEAEYDGSSAVSVKIPDVLVVKVGTDKKCSHTRQEIVGAVSAGKACTLVYYNGQNFQYSGLTTHNGVGAIPVFSLQSKTTGGVWMEYKVLVLDDYATYYEGGGMSVRNPNSLRFTGAVEATYNGSEGVTVNIPAGGSGGAGLPETADPLMQLVTDADGKVGWEERLAYKTIAEVENLASTELMGEDEDGDGVLDSFYLLTPWAVDPVPNSVVTINYNGADYECLVIDWAAIEPEDTVPGMYALGNLAAMGGEGIEGSNADAPFILVACSGEAAELMGGLYGMFIPLDGAASVTISMRSVGATYKTIEKRYIPGELLPSVTTDNEGQFLRVVGGKWLAATIDNAEGASF